MKDEMKFYSVQYINSNTNTLGTDVIAGINEESAKINFHYHNPEYDIIWMNEFGEGHKGCCG